jgi:hypothetical protein
MYVIEFYGSDLLRILIYNDVIFSYYQNNDKEEANNNNNNKKKVCYHKFEIQIEQQFNNKINSII